MSRPSIPALLSVLILATACPSEEEVEATPAPLPRLDASVVDSISAARMRDSIDFLASDERGGRIPESPGHDAARDWIIDELTSIGLEPLGLDGYVYRYEHDPVDARYFLDANGDVQESVVTIGQDLVGLLPGSDPTRADEYILIAAHYDHLGVNQAGEVFNGAFDNASGVALVLEVARALVEHDVAPARSTVFLITDDEEAGLHGARVWTTAPTVPLEDIVAMVSVDPVGRPMLPDFAPTVLIGTERSPRFQELLRRTAEWSEQPLLFIQRDLVRVFGSDQDAFYEANPPVPGGWLVNPGMAFYHQVTDTPETIDYNVLLKTARWTLEALNVLGEDDVRYPWEGPPEIDTVSMIDAQSVIEGLLGSEHLDPAEREEAETYYWTLQGAIDAEDPNEIPNYDAFIAEVLFFLLLEVPSNHPGPIPPPFPG